MRVLMRSTEAVYPDGFEAGPLMARRGKSYDLPDDVAAQLVADQKADPERPAELAEPAQAEPVKPSKRKVAGPAETKTEIG